MFHEWEELVRIPQTSVAHLQTALKETVAALEDSLVSIVLYGSAVKDHFCEATSDLNLLLVFREVTTNTLDAFSPVLRNARKRLPLAVMLYEEADLARSTDVFPIKFLDLQSHHLLLWGADVVTPLKVQEDHLRLRCEQELKNLTIRLRALYLQQSLRAEQLEQTLERRFSSLLVSLEALLYLKTGERSSSQADTMKRCATHLDTDPAVLATLQKVKRREVELSFGELKALFEDLMKLVAMTALTADKLEV